QHIPIGTADTSRKRLLAELTRIWRLGWINSQRLRGPHDLIPCAGTNCGGYTMEAQLGILPNSNADPDYEGWEIKAHAVENLLSDAKGPLTLMTPQPTGGLYCDHGAEAFVRRYGYPDKKGKLNRYNFSSPHRYGIPNKTTGLTLQFIGFDP